MTQTGDTQPHQSSEQPEEKPLIHLSPDIKLADFDLDSLDPLKSSSLENVSRVPSNKPLAAVRRSQVMTHSNSWNSFTDMTRPTSSPSSVRTPSAQNFVSGWQGAAPKPNYSPFDTNPFGSQNASNLPFTGMHQNNVFAQVPPFKHNPFQRSSNPFAAVTPSSNSEFSRAIPHKKLSLSPAVNQPVTSLMPRVPSDSNLLIAAKPTQQQNFAAASLNPPLSLNLKVTDEPRSGSGNEDDDDDDLMKFNDRFKPSEHMLSLESFDPLFSMDAVTPQSVTSSSRQSETRNSCASVLTTNDILAKVNAMSSQATPARHYNLIDPSQLTSIRSDVTVVERSTTAGSGVLTHKRNESSGSDLLDPFNVSDLTALLEKKRRKHAQEQEARQQLLRSDKKETKAEARVTSAPTRDVVKSAGAGKRSAVFIAREEVTTVL